MSALNKVMEYLGLVDGPEGATQEEKTTKKVVRVAPVAPALTPSQPVGVTVLGGRGSVAPDL
jgi:hypothetical protein